MIRNALARSNPRSSRRALAAAPEPRHARLAWLVTAALLALALAAALAGVTRADNAALGARAPKALPALDARVDGLRATRVPARTPATVPVRAAKPATVATAPAPAGVAGAAKPAVAAARDATPDRLAAADKRSDKAAARDSKSASPAAVRDTKRAAPLDDDGRDVLGDLGRELRDLGRWLTEHNWE